MIFVKANLAADRFGGVGACASEEIKGGDLVWREHPQYAVRLSLDEYKILLNGDPDLAEFLEHFSYPGEFEEQGQIVPVLEFATDIGSFVNHSETPNLASSTQMDEKNVPILIDLAVRDIGVGEEILYNYRTFVPDIVAWHKATGVRTCASFLVEPLNPSFTVPKSKWRTLAAFDASMQQLMEAIESLRQGSKPIEKLLSAARQ